MHLQLDIEAAFGGSGAVFNVLLWDAADDTYSSSNVQSEHSTNLSWTGLWCTKSRKQAVVLSKASNPAVNMAPFSALLTEAVFVPLQLSRMP